VAVLGGLPGDCARTGAEVRMKTMISFATVEAVNRKVAFSRPGNEDVRGLVFSPSGLTKKGWRLRHVWAVKTAGTECQNGNRPAPQLRNRPRHPARRRNAKSLRNCLEANLSGIAQFA
jgi:hypothetical protein